MLRNMNELEAEKVKGCKISVAHFCCTVCQDRFVLQKIYVRQNGLAVLR